MGQIMKIRVEYFALLREQAGCGGEAVETDAATPDALYRELAARHGFSLERVLVKVAVNGRYVPMDDALADGDSVVFIPPVAGG